jgi:hypothetical protein
MEAQLDVWQQETGAEKWERPVANTWYHDKRIECIELGLVTTDHSWDVVRGWLTNVMNKYLASIGMSR